MSASHSLRSRPIAIERNIVIYHGKYIVRVYRGRATGKPIFEQTGIKYLDEALRIRDEAEKRFPLVKVKKGGEA